MSLRPVLALATTLALLVPSLAEAQAKKRASPAPRPAAARPRPVPSTAAPAPTYRVEGFRSARFGMAPDAVRAAAAKDFAIDPASLTVVENPAEHTTALVVRVDRVDPGPGQAVITYIFGATKKTLMHVNVTWAGGISQPSDDLRKAVVVSGMQLSTYFRGLAWPEGKTRSTLLEAPGAVLMFGGVDANGAGVEVIATGIPIGSSDAKVSPAAPTGPTQLRVSYSADVAHPDVYKVAAGAF